MRTIVGSSAYAETLNALPLGPVQVTLRLQQRGADTHAVAAYVAEQYAGVCVEGGGVRGMLLWLPGDGGETVRQ